MSITYTLPSLMPVLRSHVVIYHLTKYRHRSRSLRVPNEHPSHSAAPVSVPSPSRILHSSWHCSSIHVVAVCQ
ncbi:hypothetical protein SCLCIDRAFT_979095 [Scleroderma citrinum Foug A]|uniref:Uncharacterized protein n=1 Tax=Scleroderma citrinum Foug A TaxID=1036808 RepID=A0A0C3DVB9_9AGAM|nr:hypothetical protein SCLCIDRAFT_979095 [Scleroderma citrinum Foug A]